MEHYGFGLYFRQLGFSLFPVHTALFLFVIRVGDSQRCDDRAECGMRLPSRVTALDAVRC